MQFTSKDALELMKQKRYNEALPLLEKIADEAPSIICFEAQLECYKSSSDWTAIDKTCDRILALDPNNISALVSKGDYYDHKHDIQKAGAFYQQALSIGSTRSNLPRALEPLLLQAQKKCTDYAAQYEQYLYKSLSTIDETAPPTPFSRSLDIMFGKTQVYLQQPTQYYFPELPSIPFFNPTQFDWVTDLEAKTQEIRDELVGNLEEDSGFTPYVQNTIDKPSADHAGMMDNIGWSALYLWKNGQRIEENIEKFPITAAALERVRKADIPGHSPTILFSLLRPGIKIPPHTGLLNTRLICHLPIIVPTNCGLRVGDQIHSWREGEAVIFDDTIQHEAWNNSNKPRYILLFDTPHPMISRQDLQGVRELFAAIQNYN